MHLTESALMTYLHGELPPESAQAALTHIADCEDCARVAITIRDADQEVASLLALLDVPMPAAPSLGVPLRPRALTSRPRGLIAAGVATLLIVGAAAAIQRGPFLGWIQRLTVGRAVLSTLTHPPSAAKTPASPSGISVVPGRRMVIRLEWPQTEGVVRLHLVGDRLITLRAEGGAVEFGVGPGEIRVDNRNPASVYEVGIPRDLASLRLLVGDSLVFTKAGEAIRSVRKPDQSGTYVIPLAPIPTLRTP